LRKLRSDFIHTGDRGFISNHSIVVDDDGFILDLLSNSEVNSSECEYYPGILTPGFINAHCHLELSHLKGKFDTGTKLIPFLKNVVSQRETEPDLIMQSIVDADHEMWAEGIVAVGDISNKTDTLEVKRGSKIYYHSFIEAFDFLQDHLALQFFEGYKKVYDEFEDLARTMVPHAPYSVSKSLFKLINQVNAGKEIVSSIHNQETLDEDLLFINKTGEFVAFWESFGFKLDAFNSIGKESVYYAMDQMQNHPNTLFIHNTQMKETQVRDVLNWNPNSFFVTCANANLYIENALPDYKQFLNADAKLCIGTDSLSSNWHLSMIEEIKTILKYNSYLKLDDVLTWATYNGAKALKQEDQLGSIQKNKRPGINWIQAVAHSNEQWMLVNDARVKRII
jgi:cytosine/adenosine deaminase-related metal-dependent hydrolase